MDVATYKIQDSNLVLKVVYIPYSYVVHLAVILIWQFGKSHKDSQINCIPLSSHLYCKHAWVSFQY